MDRAARDAQNRIALKTTRRIYKIIREVREKHARALPPSTPDGEIINGLMTKGLKTASAVLALNKDDRDYSEDALILSRSLASLAIDLAYLSANDADRFTTYRAMAAHAQKTMADQCGIALSPEVETAFDWQDIKTRVDRWRGGGLRRRAEKSKRLPLYDYAYRHGSSFEHSDGWSLLTYLPENRWAAEVIRTLGLTTTSHALRMALGSWMAFHGVKDLEADARLEAEFLKACPLAKTSNAQEEGPGAQ
jgi:hypothetical protein